MPLASEFMLPELVAAYSHQIISTLSPSAVRRALELAELHNSEQILAAFAKYVQ
jgi:hypothetical protein